MHEAAWLYVGRVARTITARRLRIVEIGSKDVNGSVRPLFEGHDYTGLDIAPGPGVDVVADGATWGEPAAYDIGICCEVLEHAPAAAAVVANLRRIVRPDGLLIITAAGPGRRPHSAVDGRWLGRGEYYTNAPFDITNTRATNPSAEYYENVEPADLIAWLDGCPLVSLEADRAAGDVRAHARNGGAA